MIKMTQISLIFVVTLATYPKALYTVITYMSCDLSHNQPISKSKMAIEPFFFQSQDKILLWTDEPFTYFKQVAKRLIAISIFFKS